MINFKLGQPVIVKAQISSFKTIKEGVLIRTWERIELEKPKRGIVAGIRCVKEGVIEGLWEGGTIFRPTKHVRAVLVATALNATLLALPEDVEDGEVEQGE